MLTDRADARTPRAIRKELATFAGRNPFNGANWRVVLAEDCLKVRGGVFKTMPSGNVSTFEYEPVIVNGQRRGYRVHHREVKPEKVETGFLEVPQYGVKGWILERWFPAHKKGMSKDAWERVMSSDGVTPMMGPYPEKGFYWMLDGPWEQIPEMSALKWIISTHIRTEENRPASYEQALLEDMHADEEAEQKTYDQVVANLAHFFESEVEPILKGTSLAAGRIRNELAAAMGDHSHQGVA